MSGLVPLTVRELKKWYRSPVFFFVGLLQPFFWIALFGSAFSGGPFASPLYSSAIDNAPNYITFVVAGVLTTTALFTGMFSGINIIWDRRLGTLSRLLASPISRSSIVFSKVLSSIARIMVQVVILILAALVIPDGLRFVNGFTLFAAAVIVATTLMIAFIFSSLFSVIAVKMRNMQSIFGISNLISLPLMFASFAMFPKTFMIGWLQSVAVWNPISWAADAMRTVIINGSAITTTQSYSTLFDLLVLGILSLAVFLFTYFISEQEIRE